MSPANNASGNQRGFVIPIGGGEEKFKNPEILDRFIEICGGKESRIGIIPTASELEDTGRNYEKLFRKIGIKHAKVLPFETRDDCNNEEYLEFGGRRDDTDTCLFASTNVDKAIEDFGVVEFLFGAANGNDVAAVRVTIGGWTHGADARALGRPKKAVLYLRKRVNSGRTGAQDSRNDRRYTPWADHRLS